MKNKLLLIIFLLVISSIKGQELQISAEPPNWWVGMKSNQLQLMIIRKIFLNTMFELMSQELNNKKKLYR